MSDRDTTDSAATAQLVALRKLGPDGRVRIAVEMSEDARRIAIEGVRRRHPELTLEQARREVLRAAWGEALASRVFASLPSNE